MAGAKEVLNVKSTPNRRKTIVRTQQGELRRLTITREGRGPLFSRYTAVVKDDVIGSGNWVAPDFPRSGGEEPKTVLKDRKLTASKAVKAALERV